MSFADQTEYKHLLSTRGFLFIGRDEEGSEFHRVFKAYEEQQTWARFVWLISLYGGCAVPAEEIARNAHGSAKTSDLTKDYRKHHPNPMNKVQIKSRPEPVKQQKRLQDSAPDNQTPTKKQATTFTSSTPTQDAKMDESMKLAKAQAASQQSGSPSLETTTQASSSQSRLVDSTVPKALKL